MDNRHYDAAAWEGGCVDLSTAIDEFVGMLTLGSEALRRLAEREAEHEARAAVEGSLDKIRFVAERLSAIATDLRARTTA